MGCKQSGASHRCVCRQPVPELRSRGAALWSQSPVVAMKMASAFDTIEQNVVRLEGDDWPDKVEAFLKTLSPTERGELLATEIDAAGQIAPWRARPVHDLLGRVRSPWLPRLLNATATGCRSGTRLVSHFQPIVDVARGKVVAFEALARGLVDGNLMPAGPLIDAARAHGAMFQFDQLARKTAIREGWPQLQRGEKLFINFAPTVIYDPAVCLQSTWQAVEEVGCDPTGLMFEVVESEQFPDMDHLRRILDAYRDMGAQVALDDLGSGRTALHYIDSLHPDLIKLDRNLLPTNPREANLALLRGLVDYAHGQGIRVLAEGVETAEQYEMVQEVNVDMAQGWYFARPAATVSRDVMMLAA